jgi:hypothetical protein
MGIFIQNIDANPRQTGKHRYRISINGQEIVQFDHKRELGLGACLLEASKAVEKQKWDLSVQYYKEITSKK